MTTGRSKQSPTHGGVASALAAVEQSDRAGWEARFFGILRNFAFLPGGRIQAGAGTPRNVTLFNCFVMGAIEDFHSGIFRALQESAVTMQQGGGIGCDFSTLRPRGTRAKAPAPSPRGRCRSWIFGTPCAARCSPLERAAAP